MSGSTSSSSALRSPRPVLVLAASLLVALMFGLGALADSAAADDAWVEAGWDGGDIPNVAVVLRSIASTDPAIAAEVVPALAEAPGVQSAYLDVLDGGPPVVYVTAEGAGSLPGIERVAAELSDNFEGGELIVAGQLAADARTERVATRTAVVTIGIVLVLTTAVVAALHGLAIGLGSGMAITVGTALGGLIGRAIVGGFDGTLASTVVPGSIAGLLVGSVLAFRLTSWFKHPSAGDAADNIVRSLRATAPDTALAVAPLGLLWIAFALLGRDTAPAAGAMLGAVFGLAAVAATLPAFLTTQPPVPDNTEFRAVPMRPPDGRDLPLVVVGALAVLLLALGLFAVQSTLTTDLLDGAGGAESAADAELLAISGDPASAIRAVAPEGVDPGAFGEWARVASEYPGVSWVYTADGRIVDGALLDGSIADLVASNVAIVSPADSARSEDAQATVRALESIESPVPVTLSGAPVDVANATEGATSTLWIAIAILALGAGLVSFAIMRDLGLAAVVMALRLLTTTAAAGAYVIVVGTPSVLELLVLVVLTNLAVSLFEVGLLRAITAPEDPLHLSVAAALSAGGGPAMLAALAAIVVGFGFLSASVDGLAAFGIGLALGLIVEMLIGCWLIRAVVIGEQAVRLLRPGFRNRAILGRRGPVSGEPVNPEWRRIVSTLLREEFRFQTEPDGADLGAVFVEDTPLFQELSQHNMRLRKNGLRIAGEGPTVVSVKAVNDGDPVTVAITVDHPSRQLLGPDNRLLGVRQAERRDGMLWLAQDPSGRYRIAEAVDMGSGVPIPEPVQSAKPANV